MTVKELIEKLSKLDPDLECFMLDGNAQWCKIVDVWREYNESTSCIKNFAYLETLASFELD